MAVNLKLFFIHFFLVCLIGIINVHSQGMPNTIKVGVYENPPKISINEKGEPSGFFIDVIEYIADQESLKIEYVHKPWSQLIEALKNGEIDLLPDVAYTPQRDSLFQFNSIPVIESWLEIYTSKNQLKEIKTVQDLENKRIGVLKGSVQESYLKNKLNKNFSINYTVIPYIDYPTSINALRNSDVDVLIADRFFLFSDSYNEQIVSTGIVLRPTNLFLAFSPGTNAKHISVFDSDLSVLRNDADSEYYKILHTWLNRDLSNPLAGYVKWIVFVFLGLLALVLGFNFFLHRQVQFKTKQLLSRNKELILAKEKAEESERLKTAFLQNMSHEIRTPMNGILGFMNLMKKEDLNRKIREEYIDIVIKSGKRLQTTINNIVEFSKIRSRLVEVNLRKANVEDIMRYHEKFFQPLAKEKNLEIEIEKQVDGPAALIITDRNMLDGILTNLINNAIKFTRNGQIVFGNYIENNQLIFYVKDSGTGIPEELIESIFNPFVQGNQEISRAYEGSGLGLSIAKEYLDLLKGRLWLKTKVNEGSTFYFSIPYIKSTSKKYSKPTEMLKLKFENRRILVAEDDNISYLLLSKILDKLGLETVRARDGEEAITIALNDKQISLILMDVKMPKKSGFEAAIEIRNSNTDIPIIAQTAFADNEYKENAFNIGFNGYIDKPIDEGRLIEILKKFLPVLKI